MVFLSIIIFLKNLFFFGKVWQMKEYRIDRISDWIKNENGLKIIFNKFFFIYGILFFSYFFIPEKYFIYGLLGIFFAEIFLIFYKLFQNKLIIPKFTGRFSLIFLVSVILNIFLFYQFQNTLFLVFLLNFQFGIFGFGIFLTYPIAKNLKSSVTLKAKNKISKFKNLKKVGITGSYGKSTVKEFLSQIFGNNFASLGTFKNQNTPLGISNLILNKLDDTFEYFFCEMGAYKKGEIEELGEIVDHKYGFLTGINNQHLSLFGSQTNIVLGKSEIVKKVFENNGTLYVNGDNFYCRKAQFPKGLNLVFYGLDNVFNSAYSEIKDFSENGINFDFFYKGEQHNFNTKVIGKHNISNLTGVLAFSFDQGLNEKQIQTSLDSLRTPEKNLELTKKILKNKGKKGGDLDIFLINDTYNINFDGVISACESLKMFGNAKKILVVDDILELGKDSKNIHFELGEKIAEFDFDEICIIGREFRSFVEKGLLKNNFPQERIYFNFVFDFLEKNIGDNGERQIFLFEGMHSEKYFKQILNLK